MVRAVIYIEGGDANDASSLSDCREAFRKLLDKVGFGGRMPKLVARGGRQRAYSGFLIAHKENQNSGGSGFVALLVDSEDPVADIERPWDHLAARPNDAMPRPKGATDEQAFLMTTCMETWIIADRTALAAAYGKIQTSALPPRFELESRRRHDVQDRLVRATDGGYAKGTRSFRILERVEPDRIRDALPSFRRLERILHERLG